MKTARCILSVMVLLAFLGMNEAMGQWATSGTNIYNTNSGNVGIGNNSPATLLYVAKNMTEPTITVRNLGGIGGATYQMYDNASGADWKFKATNAGGFKIRDHAYAMDVFTIEANSSPNSLYINAAGNVGIGTNNPGYKLFLETGDFYIHDAYPFIFLDNTSTGGNAGLTFRQNGAYRAWIFFDEGESLLRLNAEAGGGSRNDLVIKANGNVCIGTTNDYTGYKLSVDGKAVCEEVLVENSTTWPDYVFKEDYDLMTLQELEQRIRQNNHLPGIPSAAEVDGKGFHLGDMQIRVLEKVEELTLYTIEQDKQIRELTSVNSMQGKQIEELLKRIEKLEKKRK